MDAHVHYALTRRWALEAGFSEEDAELIADADQAVDAHHPGGLLHVYNWSYHYRLFGAKRLAEQGARAAVDSGSLQELGVALHRAQDTIAHGWLGLASHAIDPMVDVWEHRSDRDRDRIESVSRSMLAAVAQASGKTPAR